MKVLWITNIIFPEVLQLLTGNCDFRVSGGWMLGAANALIRNQNVKLAVATNTRLIKKLERLDVGNITYYLYPSGKANDKYYREDEKFWRYIKESFQPDIVHIHGTEYPHGLAYVNACGAENVVVSIQGLISIIANYYNYGLSNYDIISHFTCRDLIKGSLFKEKRSFRQRGKYEIELIQKVSHVIGRTSWDRDHIWAINPNSKYHFCNETLRTDFYEGQWNYDRCIPYTIFTSSASYPVKGFHQLLKAMPFILRKYPEACIRVAGHFYPSANFFQRMKMSGYANYLSDLIKKFGLDNHVTFLGPLTVSQMKEEYLKSNVFVCPSSIENSSNSLAEAQILSVPCVASYVGGLPSLMEGDEAHLYRFEDTEMLAYLVSDIFDGHFNYNMRGVAKKRHDPSVNLERLMEIYNMVHNEK